MIAEQKFWDEEGKAAILTLNAEFVRHDNANELIDRVRSWIDLVEKNGKRDITMVSECPDPSSDRIFKLDAVRTFCKEDRRAEMVTTLASIWHEMRDYSQGMGYLVAFLSMFLKPEEIVRICLTCDQDAKYIPGMWRLAPEIFQRDARVYQKVVDKRFPELSAQLKKYTVPEAYTQKYFTGMNIHLLPYKYLFDYLELFFQNGYIQGFKFAIAVLEVLEKDLMAAKDPQKIMQLLRLDKTIYPPVNPKEDELDDSVFAKVMDAMHKVEFVEDLDDLRRQADAELAEEKEKRKKREAELAAMFADEDEGNFSDEN